MKKLILLTAFFSFPLWSQDFLVGKPIESELKDQVCHLSLESSEKQGTCSGVRLSQDYILTAQHCARDIETGASNTFSVRCGSESLEIEKVYESTRYSELIQKKTQKKALSGLDFSLLKIKKPKAFSPKFKVYSNFEEARDLFLENSEGLFSYVWREPTHCELHGYGLDENGRVGSLNSVALESTIDYAAKTYPLLVSVMGDLGFMVSSPFLPIKNKSLSWLYSSLRPGDSGGPLFCRAPNGEWFLTGIASTLQLGTCPEDLQIKVKPKNFWERLFKKPKTECSMNTWGLPTRDRLEKIFGLSLAY